MTDQQTERPTVFCVECGTDHEVFDRQPNERIKSTSVYKQIAPADGWVALFHRNEPDETGRYFFTDSLAVWVLIERDGSAFVGGLCGSHMHEEPWRFGNFLTYATCKDIAADPDRFNDWAKRAAEARQEADKKGGGDVECLACGGRTNRLRPVPEWVVEVWRLKGTLPEYLSKASELYGFAICDGCDEPEPQGAILNGDVLDDWFEWAVLSAEANRRPRLQVIEGGFHF